MRAFRATATALVCLGAASLAAPSAARERTPNGTVVQDLAYGEVLFHFFQEDYFTALTRLLAAQQRNELKVHAAEAELMLGGLYLSYGQHRLAGQIFERLLAQSVEPEFHDRAWFFLAKIWYQRGYLAEAEAALARIGAELPEALEPERRMLHAEVLMSQGRFEEALAVLSAWRRPSDEWVGYAKYNVGVALVRLGRVEEGARVLNEVGTLDPENPALAALRDKANVALGYAWLQAGRPLDAKPSLQRVRLEGPFSNKALLGVGWADAELQDYRAALAPWLALKDRSLLDAAVQESLLAVPYAFARLGADRQAADYYTEAIAAFDAEIARLQSSIEAVRRGQLIDQLLGRDPNASGWYWRLEDVPDTVESRYLYELLATHRFQEGLKNYRDLLYLDANLDRWQQSLGAFDDILDTRERAYRERLPVVEASLARIDLERLATQRLELEARLSSIERNEDVVALGTPREQALWRDLAAVEAKLARLGTDPAAEELRAKHRFLKGLLLWDLRRDYKARLWAEKKSLRELDRLLKEAQRRHHQVESARQDWPEKFAALTARVDALEPRVHTLRDAVRSALARQEAFLRDVAVEELEAQLARLDTYRVQGRFALASIYDRAAAARPAGEPQASVMAEGGR
ncbi:MAG TPA: tetratricopeptide repeat protein [Gammaproteobacteria bacterium]